MHWDQMNEFGKALQAQRQGTSASSPNKTAKQWARPPHEGYVKINWDASLDIS
jgi:hypothetical protein